MKENSTETCNPGHVLVPAMAIDQPVFVLSKYVNVLTAFWKSIWGHVWRPPSGYEAMKDLR